VRGRRRGFARRTKRTVAWIPGLNTFDAAVPISNRLTALAALPGVANTWFASFAMTTDADLSMHGGEDAVLVRTVGRLGFMEGRRDAGAGPAAAGFPLRILLVQVDVDPSSSLSGARNWLTSAALGSDDILHTRDVIVPATAIGAAGGGWELGTQAWAGWTDFDIKVKRKLQNDRQVTLVMQTVFPVGTVGADFRLVGMLRMLMMRPR